MILKLILFNKTADNKMAWKCENAQSYCIMFSGPSQDIPVQVRPSQVVRVLHEGHTGIDPMKKFGQNYFLQSILSTIFFYETLYTYRNKPFWKIIKIKYSEKMKQK